MHVKILQRKDVFCSNSHSWGEKSKNKKSDDLVLNANVCADFTKTQNDIRYFSVYFYCSFIYLDEINEYRHSLYLHSHCVLILWMFLGTPTATRTLSIPQTKFTFTMYTRWNTYLSSLSLINM